MFRLTIRGRDEQVVWEGEGELHLDPGPRSAGLPARVILRQQEVRPTEVRSRELDLTAFLREVASHYTVRYLAPDFPWSRDADPLALPEPPRPDRMVLDLDYPAQGLGWLADVLNQPFETPEERRARNEEFESRMRRIGQGSLALGVLQSMAPDFQRLALAQDRYRQASLLSEEEIHRLYADMVRTPEDWRRALGFDSSDPPPLDPSWIGAAGDFGDTFPDVLERIQARSAEHEEAITSARSAFPYDPLGYGRIYPGDAGTSRWTPPEDPDEKIRSCP
jgi:hypothetical protein